MKPIFKFEYSKHCDEEMTLVKAVVEPGLLGYNLTTLTYHYPITIANQYLKC